METLGIKELRDRLSQVIRSGEKGLVVRIVRHGVAVAELRPIPKDRAQETRKRLADKGLRKGGSGRVRKSRRIPHRRCYSGSVSDLVVEDRR
ncbi:MAG: hypothetical protein K9K88_04610 [Desulfobacterales bacterium]|nr:hypothetical protein [Desulfobacterales bacterium]